MIEAPFYIGLWMLAGFGIYWRLSQKEIKVHRIPAAPELLLIHHLYYKHVAFNNLFKKENSKFFAYIWLWFELISRAQEEKENQTKNSAHIPDASDMLCVGDVTIKMLFSRFSVCKNVLVWPLMLCDSLSHSHDFILEGMAEPLKINEWVNDIRNNLNYDLIFKLVKQAAPTHAFSENKSLCNSPPTPMERLVATELYEYERDNFEKTAAKVLSSLMSVLRYQKHRWQQRQQE